MNCRVKYYKNKRTIKTKYFNSLEEAKAYFKNLTKKGYVGYLIKNEDNYHCQDETINI